MTLIFFFLFLFLITLITLLLIRYYIPGAIGNAPFTLIWWLDFLLKSVLLISIGFFIRIYIISIFNLNTNIYLDSLLFGIPAILWTDIIYVFESHKGASLLSIIIKACKGIFYIFANIKDYNSESFKMPVGGGDSSNLKTPTIQNNSIPNTNPVTLKSTDDGNTSYGSNNTLPGTVNPAHLTLSGNNTPPGTVNPANLTLPRFNNSGNYVGYRDGNITTTSRNNITGENITSSGNTAAANDISANDNIVSANYTSSDGNSIEGDNLSTRSKKRGIGDVDNPIIIDDDDVDNTPTRALNKGKGIDRGNSNLENNTPTRALNKGKGIDRDISNLAEFNPFKWKGTITWRGWLNSTKGPFSPRAWENSTTGSTGGKSSIIDLTVGESSTTGSRLGESSTTGSKRGKSSTTDSISWINYTWGHPGQLAGNEYNGPLLVYDPLNQGERGYDPNGTNQPLAGNLSKALQHQKHMNNGSTYLSKYTFNQKHLEFLFNHLYHNHREDYDFLMKKTTSDGNIDIKKLKNKPQIWESLRKVR